MNSKKYIFSQIVDFIPKRFFDRLVERSDDRTKNWEMSFWSHLLILVFGQLDGCKSLREVVDVVRCQDKRAYHLGFGKGGVSIKTLSVANKIRDYRVFEAMAAHMMRLAEKAGTPREFALHGKYYAFDSTTLDLCMSMFSWAKFRSTKSGVKLHMMFDVVLQIPAFYRITNANVHDVNTLDDIPYESNACYIFDRGYFDLRRLYLINLVGAFFVIREKRHPSFEIEIGEDLLDGDDNVLSDQVVRFASSRNSNNYPARIRRVIYYVPELKRSFVYYTNNFFITASEVAYLYKNRWQVETFFKWIKQHLKVTTFWGTNENAVRIQINVAIITYCLMHIIRHSLNTDRTTYEVMRVLSSMLLTKDDMFSVFSHEKEQLFVDGQLTLNF